MKKKNITQIPTLPNKPISSKNKVSGHLTDLRLLNQYNRDKKGLEPIWNTLSQNTQDKIKDETIIEGIRLSVAEDRLIHSVLNLFYQKGINDQLGNLQSPETMFGNINLPVPKLRIKPNEFYMEVTGKKRYSGKEIENIKNCLQNLQNHKFLMVYKRHRKQGKNTVIDRIEEYQSILKVSSIFEGISIEEDQQLDNNSAKIRNEKEEWVFSLNPIFIDQIDTKFTEYPQDINKLTNDAAGGARYVNDSTITLRNYIFRIISSHKNSDKKTITFNINREKLIYTLGLEKFLKEGRKKKVEDHIKKSIETCKNMGLISSVKITKSVNNEEQYNFIINLQF